MFYRNLDIVVDMVDGYCSVWFVKYEFLIYVKINKIKYVIGFIYFIFLIEGILDEEEKERLIVNRCVNL